MTDAEAREIGRAAAAVDDWRPHPLDERFEYRVLGEEELVMEEFATVEPEALHAAIGAAGWRPHPEAPGWWFQTRPRGKLRDEARGDLTAEDEILVQVGEGYAG